MILAAAETLLVRAKSSNTEDKTQDNTERLGKLEQRSTESAQLLHDIAMQMDALSAVQKSTAKRAQVAVVLGMAALALALGACMLILLS
jgi:ABC-type enterochelin transport system substrate-binding protein